MTEAGCAFCTVVAALEHSDACPARAAGHVLRKIPDLPATELFDLPHHESTQYFHDMLAIARAIAAAFHPRKKNCEVLGNTVAHLHRHLFRRYDWDPNPKEPTWATSHTPRVPGPEEYADTLAAIRRHLA